MISPKLDTCIYVVVVVQAANSYNSNRNYRRDMIDKKDMDLCNADKPLFTGDYTRDTAVSIYEKCSEAAKVIYNAVSVKRATKKKGKEHERI